LEKNKKNEHNIAAYLYNLKVDLEIEALKT